MNARLSIIGLAGTNGSGKDTVGHLLAAHYNYWFISVTDLLRAECHRRGIPEIRENTRMISAEWRRQFGLSVLVDRSIEAFEEVGGNKKYTGVVMASLRNPYEADRIHELGGAMVWIDADPRVRYDRIRANSITRAREDDNKTYEQFLAEEEAEMRPPAGSDQAVLNGAAVKERSDVIIINSNNDLNTFKKDIAKALGL